MSTGRQMLKLCDIAKVGQMANKAARAEYGHFTKKVCQQEENGQTFIKKRGSWPTEGKKG